MSYISDARKFFSKGVKSPVGVAYQGHREEVTSVAWNVSGGHLASGSSDKTAVIWQVRSHKPV